MPAMIHRIFHLQTGILVACEIKLPGKGSAKASYPAKCPLKPVVALAGGGEGCLSTQSTPLYPPLHALDISPNAFKHPFPRLIMHLH